MRSAGQLQSGDNTQIPIDSCDALGRLTSATSASSTTALDWGQS
jgi:hypothetical protein